MFKFALGYLKSQWKIDKKSVIIRDGQDINFLIRDETRFCILNIYLSEKRDFF